MFEKIKSTIFKNRNKNIFKISIKHLDDLKYFNEAGKIFLSLKKYNDNYEMMFVGGAVRKILKQEPINDADIATNIEPKDLIKILKERNIRYLETGINHGTITVFIKNLKFEITTLRKDLKTDGRHADVKFISNWELDAARRDFTINAIYTNLYGEIYDPLNGRDDLHKGIVRFIGDPNKRIKEDYLRILRYIRFFTQYSKHDHEKDTIKAIKLNFSNLVKISKERKIQELFKMFDLSNLNEIFKNKFSSFIITSLFPELKKFHRLNFLEKIYKETSLKLNRYLILSIMLVDETEDSEYFIYKYNLSTEAKNLILFLKKNHNKYSLKYILDKKNISRLIYLYSKKFMIDLILFQIFNDPNSNRYSHQKIKKIENYIKEIKAIEIPTFPINANYLKYQFNFLEGKQLGQAIKKLENIWLDNNFEIDKNEIKSILKI